jgi:hypothetical protein
MGSDLLCFKDATLGKKIFLLNLRGVRFDTSVQTMGSAGIVTLYIIVLNISPFITRGLYFDKAQDQ